LSLIVFEDEHLLVVNKPEGWNTHAPSPFAGEGLYEWLKHREPRWAHLAIIHRLDKETSGLMVFGKTPAANRSLTRQFTERTVKKIYWLLTDRAVRRERFTVTSALVRAGEKYMSRNDGEPAETRFSLRGTMNSPGGRPTLAWLLAEPVTGRTHQIRVHAAENGFPILGDTLYGGTTAERVFLHAAELAFAHPVTGEPLKFEAPPGTRDATDEQSLTPDDVIPHWCKARTGQSLRDAVLEPSLTNSFRVIHGANDRWPGVFIEKLGDFLLVQSEALLSSADEQRVQELARALDCRGVYHKRLSRNVRRTSVEDASPRLLFGEAAPERFTMRENGLLYELSFSEGYSVGLFLDQRDNRRRFLAEHVAAEFPLPLAGREVLNTFAYTCGFSVAAAQAGARSTSLDLSRKYLDWGKRNFALNGLAPEQHDFIFGDAFDWMRRLAKKGRTFDVVVLDPPTFSQSKESGTWQAERHYERLAAAAVPLLKPGGVLLASTNAARLEPESFVAAVKSAAAQSKRRVLQQHYVPQPPDFPVSRAEPAYLKTLWLRLG
jgi:23S rRNA (cytosine1962-C5)-methyltransferase